MVLIPLILLFLPTSTASSTASSATASPAATGYSTPLFYVSDDDDDEAASSSLAAPSSETFPPSPPSSAIVGGALLRTDLASAWGVAVAAVHAGLEAGKWWAFREVAGEGECEGWRGKLRALGGVAWRAAVLHALAYPALFSLDLLRFHPTHVTLANVLTLVAWPVLSTAVLVALFYRLVSPTDGDEETAWPTALAARNALFLVLVSSTGQEVSTTASTRLVFFAIYATVALFPLWRQHGRKAVSGIRLPVALAELPLRTGSPALSASSAAESEAPSSTYASFLFFPPRRLAVLAGAPFAVFYLALLIPPCTLSSTCPTIDLVISHFDRPLPATAALIREIRRYPLLCAAGSQTRVVVYHKGELGEEELWAGLDGALKREKGDSVVLLSNIGREGGTYLTHLLSRYDASTLSSYAPASVPRDKPLPGLADTTLLFQPHLARDFLTVRRLNSALVRESGFLSLGAYLSTLCGMDSRGAGFYAGVKRVWSAVYGEQVECREGEEQDRRAATWSGQLALGRETVLGRQKELYERIQGWLEAPNNEPIHGDWGPTGPSTQVNPAFGHSLERSWPLIFGCDDPRLEQQCADDAQQTDKCQCFEPQARWRDG
ncbi:nicotinate phosphoribosyltransferase [Rhodosporidiobolus nylandii]